MEQSRYLGGGQWLDPLDSLTLAKNYPIRFVRNSFLFTIRLNIAEHGVYERHLDSLS
jgi:hypothetical protein